ncbi:MAG: hypothetical protein J7605_07055 [Variovorax sp.]|nr:hypothetical protein [Variovorax sp.]
MADKLQDFPFWLIEFDKAGALEDAGAIDRLIADLESLKITDLFVFSHGWNNDHAAALALYDRFFGEVRKVLNTTPPKSADTRMGVVGIVWPSILWPDDAQSASMNHVMTGGGGGASMGGGPPVPAAQATPAQVLVELRKGYDDAGQLALLGELTAALEASPKSEQALKDFRAKLGQLLASESAPALDSKQPDNAEGAIARLSDQKWRQLLEVLGERAMSGQASAGGAAAFGDPFKKLWAGAKDALRVGTYWQMKERAGVVGQKGLGAQLLAQIAAKTGGTRVHLLGHSFGARLVSFSLLGMPSTLEKDRSPVKSLFLLQGAFSHFAFADQLPHDQSRSGALKGMAVRVDGPLMTTFSQKDLAVGRSYPVASFANQDDSAAAQDQVQRWGGMGFDGAQAVSAVVQPLAQPGQKYPFAKGKWLNLDGNTVIVHGGLPSGAHSDIAHPHTAWAALAAAGVV